MPDQCFFLTLMSPDPSSPLQVSRHASTERVHEHGVVFFKGNSAGVPSRAVYKERSVFGIEVVVAVIVVVVVSGLRWISRWRWRVPSLS